MILCKFRLCILDGCVLHHLFCHYVLAILSLCTYMCCMMITAPHTITCSTCTVFPRVEARARISFVKFWTWPLNVASLYLIKASIISSASAYVHCVCVTIIVDHVAHSIQNSLEVVASLFRIVQSLNEMSKDVCLDILMTGTAIRYTHTLPNEWAELKATQDLVSIQDPASK